MDNLTLAAVALINEKYFDKEIIKTYETIGYDGFDSFGPKSYLYDLYVCYKNNNNNSNECFVDYWHWERRFSENEDIGYIAQDDSESYNLKDFLNKYNKHHYYRYLYEIFNKV